MKIAFVHDWLQTMGGAEKVLEALLELYDAPIYTLVKGDLKGSPFSEKEIYTSFLQRLPLIERYFRYLFPLFPRAIESLDLSAYDLIFSSSYCVAKSVRRKGDQKHICYCHTPMRYAWDLDLYPLHPIKKLVARPFLKHLREYDRITQCRVDHFIANSSYVAERIKKNYGREATVIHPPVDTDRFTLVNKREDYFITCSRLVPYKRIDLLIETFRNRPQEKLLIVGEGPERRKLSPYAPGNVQFMGYLPTETYIQLLSQAKGFVYGAEEDFGIVLAEAGAAGIPVIAYGKGGSRDIVVPGKTGLFFPEQTVKAIGDALDRFKIMQGDFEPEKIKEYCQRFSKERFLREITEFMKGVCQEDRPVSSYQPAFSQ